MTMACDCKVKVKPTAEPDIPWGQIEYCPMHKAAGQMLEALRVADRNFIYFGGYVTDQQISQVDIMKMRAAIAAAEPKKE